MADELDEFLKQAAQRRMQRQQEKQTRQNAAPPAPTPQNRPSPPRKPKAPSTTDFSQPRPAIFEDNQPISERSLEPSIAQRHVTTQIDQADEGIDAYVRSTIGESSSLGNLQKRQQTKKESTKSKSTNQSEERPTIVERPNDIVGSSELIRQLRDPKTLRMAILAHEILRRPYQ